LELGNIERNLGDLKSAVEAYMNSIKLQDGALARNNIADIMLRRAIISMPK